jgi:hypothetical protein
MTDNVDDRFPTQSLGAVPLQVFATQSVAWLESILDARKAALSERLAEWRNLTRPLYERAATGEGREYLQRIDSCVTRFSPWTMDDIQRVLKDSEGQRASSETLVAAQREVLLDLLHLVQQEQERLKTATSSNALPSPARSQSGALPLEYLTVVAGTLSVPHRPPAAAWGVLWERPVPLARGLTDVECAEVEKQIGIRFPPDLRSLLQFVLPVGPGFPNWHEDAPGKAAADFSYLLGGITFDIEHNAFWLPSWGPKPADASVARDAAEAALHVAPRLVRIFGHRFIPDTPEAAGNPVFSVVQTDIVHYGNDLADYYYNEFGVPRPPWAATEPRHIPFWTELAS